MLIFKKVIDKDKVEIFSDLGLSVLNKKLNTVSKAWLVDSGFNKKNFEEIDIDELTKPIYKR